MLNILNSGTGLTRQGYLIAIIDITLANIGIILGCRLASQNASQAQSFEYTEAGWDSISLQILQLPYQLFIIHGASVHFLLFFAFSTFILEATLSVLLVQALRKLNGSRLRIWFRIRLVFFLLIFICLVIQTVNLRDVDDPVKILEQGLLGIVFMVYKGYGLVIITCLEELAYKSFVGTQYAYL